MLTAIVSIFSTLQIINLDEIIIVINIIRAIILTIAIIVIIMAISSREKSLIFVEKKIVAIINIKIISNRSQKNFRDEAKNIVEIKANTIHFWLIIKGIQMMILMISMKKQIIETTITKIIYIIS